MEELMQSAVNAEAAGPVVEGPEAGAQPQEGEGAAGEPAGEQGAAAPAGQTEGEQQQEARPQTRRENAAFAAARRQAEQQARAAQEAASRLEQQNRRLMEALAGYGYDTRDPLALADQLEAQARQTTVEAVQAQRARREEELRRAVESSPELLELRAQKEALERREAQRTFADDLAAVKRYNKAEKAASVEELGETFLRARAMGLDPLAAYDIVQKERERSAAQRPPEIGAVAAGTGGDKGYYTEAELDRLTGKDLDDPGILAKAVASLSRLKR